MKTKRLILFLFFSSSVSLIIAQPYRQVKSLRVFVDNDYLNIRGAGTDRYYTNGIRLDYFYKKKEISKFPSSLLLNVSRENNNVFGWGLAQFMFTPQNISLDEIQQNDRPYGGALYSVHSLQSVDSAKKVKVTTELFLGVIGPMSLAKQTQTFFHRLINSTIPEGWDNQVSNDIIINYNITIEKQLLHLENHVLLVGIVETYSGTLYNAAGSGFKLRIGKFNDYLSVMNKSKVNKKNQYNLYVFMKPVVRIVISNALLEGGLINALTNSERGYTIDKDQLERITYSYDVGIAFETKGISISFIQKLRTAEYKGSYSHEVGNIIIQFKI